MDGEKCSGCQYFRQHYAFNERTLFRVYCGHCVFSRVKHKRPDAGACKDFLPALANAETFATKEYLSKELLGYVLRLPLLPEIQEYPRFSKEGE